jgi:glycosyltransferase involved in cell wall biosynthesis
VTADPPRRTKVLWLTKGLGPGGMERLLVNHARFGDHERFEFHAAYLIDRPHSLVGELEGHGVTVHRLVGGDGARWVWSLRQLVRRLGVDVVHSHSPMMAVGARLALRTLRPRPTLVYTEHNSWSSHARSTRAANALTYRLDDAQIAVSAEARADGRRWARRPAELLAHGVDLTALQAARAAPGATREALGVGEATPLAITVANLRAPKAHDVLLDAARLLADRRLDFAWICVGHGPLAELLAARRDELGLRERVRFLGFRDDIPDLLRAADVFVLSSREEGLPLAVMEAMSLGLPVVATDVGGLASIITSGEDGVLVSPGSPTALADAVGRVMTDVDLWAKLGTAARRRATTFDARIAVARIEEIYALLAR